MRRAHTHYDNIMVARNAPDEVVRAAYKTLTQKYHPDRNPGNADAARIMQILNDSYAVLSDPVARREHDEWIARVEQSKSEYSPTSAEPPSRSVVDKEPQPLPRWKSGLILASVVGVAGFLVFGADGNNGPAPGPKPYQQEPPEVVAPVEPRFDPKDIVWDNPEEPPEVVVSVEPVPTAPVDWSQFEPIDQPPKKSPKLVPVTDPEILAQLNRDFPQEGDNYVRPASAPNGAAWPKLAGYVVGYEKRHADGLSKVTVDNGRNDSDVFVKLVSTGSEKAYPVRIFFIPAHGKFTVNKVRAGAYDVRYRDLESGGLSRSEQFNLEERAVSGGREFSEITMTLYKVQNGNMETYPLAESEF